MRIVQSSSFRFVMCSKAGRRQALILGCLLSVWNSRLIVAIIPIISAVSSFAQEIIINEIKPSSLSEIDLPWIELKNTSEDTVFLSDYSLLFDSISLFPLPHVPILPSQYFTLRLGNENTDSENGPVIDFPVPAGATKIYLIGRQFTSQISIPEGITSEESYGRYPDGSDEWIFFFGEKISRGRMNKYPGPWQKISANASFSPRDSSPNGALVFDGKLWILEGYKNMGNETYYSTSDIYNSTDGVSWNLVNANPPYNPYSAFMVFDGWMCAIETRSYRSRDGITWEDMGATGLSTGGRGSILNDMLFWTNGRAIYTSDDAVTWQVLVKDAPWEFREWPDFSRLMVSFSFSMVAAT